MRLKLTLYSEKDSQIIPFNYEYLISCWIYKTFAKADNEYSTWLHDQGYSEGFRKFKLFTFADFDLGKYRIVKEKGFLLQGESISIVLSFYIDDAFEKFIIGLFQDQEMLLWRNDISAKFKVKTVEALPKPIFRNEMTFKTLSPICISRSEVNPSGKISQQYLHPDNENYINSFFTHIIRKYSASLKYKLTQDEKIELSEENLGLKILSKPISKLITVKEGSVDQTRFRSFHYKFRIRAPLEIIEFCYYAGFGEKNSMGMGCVGEII